MNPYSMASFCPTMATRVPKLVGSETRFDGATQYSNVNAARSFRNWFFVSTQSSFPPRPRADGPLNVAAWLLASNPTNAGGRGPGSALAEPGAPPSRGVGSSPTEYAPSPPVVPLLVATVEPAGSSNR